MAEKTLHEQIQNRAKISLERYGQRNAHFNQLFDAYDGKCWKYAPTENEQRITNRIVADTVDMDVAILLSKMPEITVPESKVSHVDKITAAVLENGIVGAWGMMDMHQVLYEAGIFGSLTGWGVLRGPINTGQGDFPLVTYAIDPRAWYPGFTASKQLQWSVYQQYRTAGDIRMEVPDAKAWHPDVLPEDDAQLCVWSEYWGWHKKALIHAVYAYETNEHNVGYGTAPSGLEKGGGAVSSSLQPSELGEVLKDPTDMGEFYPGIPNHYFFPRVHPRKEPGYEGMSMVERLLEQQAVQSQVMTILATDVFFRGNTPLIGDGKILWPQQNGHGIIDTSPHGYTEVQAGTKIIPLPGSLDFNLVQQFLDTLQSIAGRSGFPAAMSGQYTPAESGLALSARNAPVLLKEGLAQKQIEACLQKFNSFLLQMLRKLPKSTHYWATTKMGAVEDVSLVDFPKGDYVYNTVKLSASLPDDVIALGNLVNQSVQAKTLSQQTGTEYLQNKLELPSRDPVLEHEKVVAETVEQAQEAISMQAQIQAEQARLQANQQGAMIPPGGFNNGGGPVGQPPMINGMPANAMAPQQMMAAMQMQGMPQNPGQVPGEVSGQQGAPGG